MHTANTTRVATLFMGLLFQAGLSAQSDTGAIQGVVKDPSGAVVPRADVTAKWGAATRTVATDGQGRYAFIGLAPGTYAVRVTAAGFTPFDSEDFALAGGRTVTLDVPLTLSVQTQRVTVQDRAEAILNVDPSNNAGALVLGKEEIKALPEDRGDLAADLLALAGPAAGPNGGQIYVDGFTGGRLPPKQSIREIRINQSPFAAQSDRPGQGRVEVFTKPGTGEYHGTLLFQFSDAALNSRNTFVATKPPYQRRQLEGELTGPINKKTSFTADFERVTARENAFINAVTLDSGLNPFRLQQAVATPQTGIESNFRIDRQLSANHTLAVRYTYARDTAQNQGIGGFSLAQRAYNTRDAEDTIQVTETAVLSARTVSETRFRFRRQQTNQSGGVAGPTITVLDSFSGGGSPVGLSYNHQNRFELQNFTTRLMGAHTLKWGGVLRGIAVSDQSMQNYPGSYIFTSLNSYRLTLLGQQSGLTAAQIRANGGGPSQFTLSAGNPLANLNQFDYGLFLQDDWKVRPNLTLSGGLRYEAQTNAHDWKDLGPRLGFAWAVGPAGKGNTPLNVIRGGAGIFYDRLSESMTLTALRQDGLRQQQFLIPNPEFYPVIPSAASLASGQQPQNIRKTDANWRAPRTIQLAIGFERQVASGITVATNYIYSSGSRALRSRNINAPLTGSGLRPFGTSNNLYLYESSGTFRQNQLVTNVNMRARAGFSFTGSYTFGYANANTDGSGTFPADQYNLATEYGRAGFDIRHRFQLNGSWTSKYGVQLSPFLTMTTGRPYNLTTGRDANGDGLFTDRPTFATDLSRSSVVQTPYGAIDRAPLPGQLLVPRNFGRGPSAVALNLRLTKTIVLRESKESDPLQLVMSVNARNLLNHPNYGPPSGNLSSPLFGQFTSLAGGGNTSGNRRLDLQVRIEF